MNDYLIDRETLGEFIDELIKKKPLPLNSAEELTTYREEQIKALDDRIGLAVFGRLTEDQNREINELFDRDEENPDVFEDFFNRAGIDLDKVIADTMESFGKEFLGGQNV